MGVGIVTCNHVANDLVIIVVIQVEIVVTRRSRCAVIYDVVAVYFPTVGTVVVIHIGRVHIVHRGVVGNHVITELIPSIIGGLTVVTIECIQITSSVAIG